MESEKTPQQQQPPSESPFVDEAFARLRDGYLREPFPTLRVRRDRLARVERIIRSSAEEICRAVSLDFGHRSMNDSRLGEIWVTLNHLKYAQKRLGRWMKPRRRRSNLAFRPGRAFLFPEPRGVVGIISPWNYPLMLSFTPLIGALAAGNRVLLKLSENTPRTSGLLKDRLDAELGDDELATLIGDVDTGRGVTRLPLDYLLFTGGNAIGKKVASAAAENLVPITLELGGKCPVVLHESYSVEAFAEKVVQGKCFSAGQSCVAPDYLLVPEGRQEKVVTALVAFTSRSYPTMAGNPDYSGVAGGHRLARLHRLVSEAVESGAAKVEINPANEPFEGVSKIPLTLLLSVPETAAVMQEEIFGPVLPIVTYRGLDEAVAYVNARPSPLALYYFDTNRARIRRVLQETRTGGVTINDTLLHFICDDLPRNPVGASGHGSYYGQQSFDAFSHLKSVFYQSGFIGTKILGRILTPPYGGLSDWIVRRLIGQ